MKDAAYWTDIEPGKIFEAELLMKRRPAPQRGEYPRCVSVLGIECRGAAHARAREKVKSSESVDAGHRVPATNHKSGTTEKKTFFSKWVQNENGYKRSRLTNTPERNCTGTSSLLEWINKGRCTFANRGIVCFMLPHEILSTRQYMLAGLKKVRDTERSEHTAIHPVVPFPCPPHLLTTLEPIRVLKISVPQKRPIFVLQKPHF